MLNNFFFCFFFVHIVLEYVGLKWRTFVANMSIAIFFTLAACLLPWIAFFLANWRHIALAISIPLALAIFTPWLVPESARWLVSQGQIEKAIEIMKKIGKINGNEVPENIYIRFKVIIITIYFNYYNASVIEEEKKKHLFQNSCERLNKNEVEGKIYSAIDLFRSPRLRKITILLIIIW